MTLKHLRSSTADKRPQASGLSDGQLAVNTASGSPGLFFKDSAGNVVKIGPVHVGSTAPNASPASGGTSGNSIGEQWLDNSGGTYVFKVWDGSAWRSEAGEFVNTTGDTMTGSLTMGTGATLIFEGSVDDGFETTITVANPTADRTITFPNVTGNVVTTGDSGTVTSAMIAAGTIVDSDVSASAAIAGTKISPNFGGQNIVTSGTFIHALASSGAPSITFSGDSNTGIYSPGPDNIAISNGGVTRFTITDSGIVRIGPGSTQAIANVPIASNVHFDGLAPTPDPNGTTANGMAIISRGGTSFGATATEYLTFYSASYDQYAYLAHSSSGGGDNLSLAGCDFITLDALTAAYVKGGTVVEVQTANSQRLIAKTTELVINDNASDYDFRVEGTTNQNLLCVDALTNTVVINGGNGLNYGPLQVDAETDDQAIAIRCHAVGNEGGKLVIASNSAGVEYLRLYSNSIGSSLDARSKLTLTVGDPVGTGSVDRLNIGSSETVINETGGNYDFRIEGDTNTNLFFVDASTDCIGIGTASPATLLHLSSTTGSATPTPTELRIATRTVGSDWSTTDPWGRISFYNADGSAFGPKIHASIDATALSTAGGASDIVFRTNNNTSNTLDARMVIKGDSSAAGARVGIGTTSPGGALEIQAAATIHPLIVQGPSSEFARIDSSGRLLVGTTIALTVPDGEAGTQRSAQLTLAGNSYSSTIQSNSFFNTVSGGAGAYVFTRSNSTTVGSHTVVSSGNVLGTLQWAGSDGTNYIRAAFIRAEVDGTPGLNDMPGRIVLSTTADGASSPTERMRITSAGNVGIGTASPGAQLEVANTSSVQIYADANGGYIKQGVSNLDVLHLISTGVIKYQSDPENDSVETSHVFECNGSEVVRIDGSGRLLVGGTIARANFSNSTITPQFQVENTTNSLSSAALIANGSASTTNPQARLFLGRSRGTQGTNVVVIENDALGAVSYQGNDGSEFVEAASIAAFVDGIPGADNMPGRLVFSTTASGASSPTPRATIDSSGRLLVGGTTARVFDSSTATLTPITQIESTGSESAISITRNTAGNTGPGLFFGKSRSGTNNGTTVVQNEDRLGTIFFEGTDGANLIEAATIAAEVDGIPGLTDMPGRLIFSTTPDGTSSPTERMRITSSGNVGIGTSIGTWTPGATLDVRSGSNNTAVEEIAAFARPDAAVRASINKGVVSGNGISFGTTTNHPLALRTNALERIVIGATGTTTLTSDASTAPFIANIGASEVARIDGSGRLLVGTTSAPPAIETLTPGLVRSGAGSAVDEYSAGLYCYRNAGGSGRQTVAPRFFFARSRSAVNNATGGVVLDNDDLGNIRFAGDDGTNFITAAEILAEVDGTPGANDMPGRIVLSTTADGASSPTERVRISANGLTTFGSQTASGAALSVTAPAKLYVASGAYTDRTTAASGTVTHGTIAAFDNPGIAASNVSVTYTNASTVYIDGAPTASTNVTVTNAYALYVNAGTSFFGGNVNLSTGNEYRINNTKVVGARVTGWTAATGTATRTAFATSTVTTAQLAERVKALIDDLISHGLIGT